MDKCKRIRLTFQEPLGAHMKRTRGYTSCWYLLPHETETVSDVIQCILNDFQLRAKCQYGINLLLDKAHLLSNQNVALIRDQDSIDVQMSLMTTNETMIEYLDDDNIYNIASDNVEVNGGIPNGHSNENYGDTIQEQLSIPSALESSHMELHDELEHRHKRQKKNSIDASDCNGMQRVTSESLADINSIGNWNDLKRSRLAFVEQNAKDNSNDSDTSSSDSDCNNKSGNTRDSHNESNSISIETNMHPLEEIKQEDQREYQQGTLLENQLESQLETQKETQREVRLEDQQGEDDRIEDANSLTNRQRRRMRRRDRRKEVVAKKANEVEHSSSALIFRPLNLPANMRNHSKRIHIKFGEDGDSILDNNTPSIEDQPLNVVKRRNIPHDLRKYGPYGYEKRQDTLHELPEHRPRRQDIAENNNLFQSRLKNKSQTTQLDANNNSARHTKDIWKRPYEIVATLKDSAMEEEIEKKSKDEIIATIFTSTKYPNVTPGKQACILKIGDIIAYKLITLCLETMQPVESGWKCGKIIHEIPSEQIIQLYPYKITLNKKNNDLHRQLFWKEITKGDVVDIELSTIVECRRLQ